MKFKIVIYDQLFDEIIVEGYSYTIELFQNQSIVGARRFCFIGIL